MKVKGIPYAEVKAKALQNPIVMGSAWKTENILR